MITAGRLKELIKQNGLIFDKYGSEIDLRSGDGIYFAFSQNRLFKMKEIPNIALEHWRLNEIFETEEQAEWHLKNDAERTERFEPPMWEDFNHYEFQFINHENGSARKIIFEVLKKQDNKAKTGGYISILNTTLLKDIYEVDTPTKENYEKACKIVHDMIENYKGEYDD